MAEQVAAGTLILDALGVQGLHFRSFRDPGHMTRSIAGVQFLGRGPMGDGIIELLEDLGLEGFPLYCCCRWSTGDLGHAPEEDEGQVTSIKTKTMMGND